MWVVMYESVMDLSKPTLYAGTLLKTLCRKHENKREQRKESKEDIKNLKKIRTNKTLVKGQTVYQWSRMINHSSGVHTLSRRESRWFVGGICNCKKYQVP